MWRKLLAGLRRKPQAEEQRPRYQGTVTPMRAPRLDPSVPPFRFQHPAYFRPGEDWLPSRQP